MMALQVRETQKSVRDTKAGIEKMSVGHHLHEKGHVITRERNTHTGDRDEQQDYLNIDEGQSRSKPYKVTRQNTFFTNKIVIL